jgi:hypothetical protein
MSFRDLFSMQPIKEQAIALAENVALNISPIDERKSIHTLSVNRITTILERAYAKANSFQNDNKFGFLKRSIFCNTFRWRLKELGYSDKFVAIATEGLVIKLCAKNSPPKTAS